MTCLLMGGTFRTRRDVDFESVMRFKSDAGTSRWNRTRSKRRRYSITC
jgi:hypothetical protein